MSAPFRATRIEWPAPDRRNNEDQRPCAGVTFRSRCRVGLARVSPGNGAGCADPRAVWPVRVNAGVFGPGRPYREMLLSPNHAVYVDGKLVPVGCLANGRSIVQLSADMVTYYHLELAKHDLLLAEVLLTETYLDVGDRANFSNGSEPMRLFADFAPHAGATASRWEMLGCAPLIVCGPELETVRARVNGLLPESVETQYVSAREARA